MASWRQPYRSALRDLAQALVDQAQVKRQNDDIQAQLKMQQDMIQAEQFQNIFDTAAQTTQNVFAQIQQGREQERNLALRENEAARNRAQADLDTARRDLATLQAYGGDPTEIERLTSLVNRLTSVVNAPIAEVGGLYSSLMGGELVPEVRTPGAPMATVPGVTTPGMQGGMNAPQAFGPPTVTPALTGAEVLSGGTGAAAALMRTSQVEDALTTSIINRIVNINPSDPVSIFQAYTAVGQLSSLPPDIQDKLRESANQALAYYENSPEAQAMTDRANRLAEADVTTAEAQAARLQQDLEWFTRTRGVEWSRLQYALGADAATAVVNAYNTGVIAGLDDAGKKELAKMLNVPVDGLAAWSQGRVADNERRIELQNELTKLQVESQKQNIKIGTQTIAMNDLAMDRNLWQFERDKFMQPMQDELSIATGIANAIQNNDPGTLAYYMNAFDDPASPLGQQLRTMFGDDYGEYLATEYAGAHQRQQYERNILQYDEQARFMQVETARLALQAATALTPLQIAALTEQYRRDKEQALLDIRSLPFQELTSTLQSLGSLAQALPPEWWDNVPKDIQDRMTGLGIDASVFKEISFTAEWVRESPQREQAWTLINTMMKSVPTDEASQIVMREGLMNAVSMMGLDPDAEMALVASLEGMWTLNNAELIATMSNLALGTAAAATPEDASRAVTAWASVEEGLVTEYERIKPQQIRDNGCADTVELQIMPGVLGLQVNTGTWRTTPEQMKASNPNISDAQASQQASTCAVLQQEYFDLPRQITDANRFRAYWSQHINSQFGVGTVPEAAPSNVTPVSPQETPAPAPESTTPVPIPATEPAAAPQVAPTTTTTDPIRNQVSVGFDAGGTPLNGPDVARFNELARMVAYSNYRSDDPDFNRDQAIADLERELTMKYGARGVDAVMNHIFGVTPAGQ